MVILQAELKLHIPVGRNIIDACLAIGTRRSHIHIALFGVPGRILYGRNPIYLDQLHSYALNAEGPLALVAAIVVAIVENESAQATRRNHATFNVGDLFSYSELKPFCGTIAFCIVILVIQNRTGFFTEAVVLFQEIPQFDRLVSGDVSEESLPLFIRFCSGNIRASGIF